MSSYLFLEQSFRNASDAERIRYRRELIPFDKSIPRTTRTNFKYDRFDAVCRRTRNQTWKSFFEVCVLRRRDDVISPHRDRIREWSCNFSLGTLHL